MQISDANKITQHFPEVIAFINENDLIAEMEVRMKNSIWDVGSRTTIYNALTVREWGMATISEKIILWEGYQMMKEMEAVVMA